MLIWLIQLTTHLEWPQDHAQIGDIPQDSDAHDICGDDPQRHPLSVVRVLEISGRQAAAMVVVDGPDDVFHDGVDCRRHGSRHGQLYGILVGDVGVQFHLVGTLKRENERVVP